MKRIQVMFAGLIGLFLAGCATVKTTAEWDHGTNFSRLNSWDWQSGIKANPGDPRIDEARLDREVRGAVSRHLAGKGYLQSSDQPDFLVAYYASLEEKVETSPPDTPDMEDAAVSERPAGAIRLNKIKDRGLQLEPNPPPAYAYEYEIGTLVVDIIDARTGKRLWRGKGGAEVDRQKPSEAKARKIVEAAHRAIAQFPPPSTR